MKMQHVKLGRRSAKAPSPTTILRELALSLRAVEKAGLANARDALWSAQHRLDAAQERQRQATVALRGARLVVKNAEADRRDIEAALRRAKKENDRAVARRTQALFVALKHEVYKVRRVPKKFRLAFSLVTEGVREQRARTRLDNSVRAVGKAVTLRDALAAVDVIPEATVPEPANWANLSKFHRVEIVRVILVRRRARGAKPLSSLQRSFVAFSAAG